MNPPPRTIRYNWQTRGHLSNSVEIFDKEIEPEEKHRVSSDGLSRLLQNLQNGTGEVVRKNERTLKICLYVILNVVFVGYFAWATHYFVNFSSDSLASTTCTGYGLLMIIFILVYFMVAYYLIIKPFLLPIVIDGVDGKQFSKIFSNRAVKATFYTVIFVAIGVYLGFDTRDNRRRLVPLLGLLVFLVFGFLFCKHPRHIKWRPVFWGLILQFGFGLLTIRWDVGRNIFDCLGNKTSKFLSYASNGSAFVYGEFLVYREAVFAFQALSTIYFLGFIINILYHYGIMQKAIVTLGEFLQAVMGTAICESVNSAANIFLGMSEAPLLLKPYLEDLTVSEIHAIMTSGFATVSGTVLAAYISFGAEASHLITASVMSAPAALCYSKLTYPETEEVIATKESIQLLKSEYSSALDAASKGAAMALELVLGITANLIAFISLIFFLNGILSWLGFLVGYDGDSVWTIEQAVGYVFMPISFIMGVPWDESEMVGKLIGIKTVVNEFAAFKEMGKMVLTKRTKMIATYAICGFSNPGSIGIMISALSVLMPKKRSAITSTVFRAFIAGEIVCFMTACIAALLIPEDSL
ncbi:solute carrier family 28 member 3-like isoform X2 [Photinus pyralis]|uniref:solute carrier family 28 member 3-like isoform X2 n=1 Tax=Photinus pyralis TaxID=7054 RepID=UPI0012673DAC|nr:solute carrier family 28 member 3-like isoform X2 [Photinus pyralis]